MDDLNKLSISNIFETSIFKNKKSKKENQERISDYKR